MIDTSAMLAALVAQHEHHRRARPHLSASTRVPAIVLAETYSQLRRTFGQAPESAARLVAPWAREEHNVLATLPASVVGVLSRAVELNLGGDVHDALIAHTCLAANVGLVTLDRGQHRIALALGVDSTYLLSDQ